MRITNLTSGRLLARNADVAESFFTRLKGLLGTKRLLVGAGLLIRPCNSVHTFGMKYPIDVVFAGRDNRVLKAIPGLRPGKLAACFAASYAVELPEGAIERTGTAPGDCLDLE